MEDRAHLKRGSHMGSFGGGGGGGGPAQPNQHPTTHNQDSVSPASHQTDLDNAPTPPFKRPRIDACRKASYPRQRALNACLNCRTRKTKCDNLRPTCSSCARINAECVFADERKDHSSSVSLFVDFCWQLPGQIDCTKANTVLAGIDHSLLLLNCRCAHTLTCRPHLVIADRNAFLFIVTLV